MRLADQPAPAASILLTPGHRQRRRLGRERRRLQLRRRRQRRGVLEVERGRRPSRAPARSGVGEAAPADPPAPRAPSRPRARPSRRSSRRGCRSTRRRPGGGRSAPAARGRSPRRARPARARRCAPRSTGCRRRPRSRPPPPRPPPAPRRAAARSAPRDRRHRASRRAMRRGGLMGIGGSGGRSRRYLGAFRRAKQPCAPLAPLPFAARAPFIAATTTPRGEGAHGTALRKVRDRHRGQPRHRRRRRRGDGRRGRGGAAARPLGRGHHRARHPAAQGAAPRPRR